MPDLELDPAEDDSHVRIDYPLMTRMTKNRARDERGFVVLTAIVLMALMLTFGLALLKIVDSQARQSRTDRTSESAFNLAEGLLYAESQLLQQNWPTKPPCTGNAATCGYRPVDSGGNA